MKGLFIVFEGIDGSGTSTQARLLHDYFLSKSKKAIISSEPSSGPIGNLIRQIMKKRIILTENKQKFDEQMAYLFAADRHDHLYNDIDGVFKSINEGYHVISTRYYFSSLVYNCQNQEDWDFIKSLNQRFPNPDLVIYIDLPVEISLQRLSDRPQKEIYETKDKLIKVSQNYRNIFPEYTGLLFQVDGRKNKQEIHKKIIKFIESKINFIKD